MYHTRTDNSFGICQLGKWESFDHNNIDSLSKEIIDLSQPFPMWMSTLKEIHNLFIVSMFSTSDQIANALDLIRICRNSLIFITVITSKENQVRSDLAEIKNATDIFLCLEQEYYEDEKIVDPVSYAIDFMANSFDEYIDEIDFKPWYEGQFYAFSQSGSAQLVVFDLMKDEYEKKDAFKLPDEVVRQITEKKLAFLYIKSGSDSRLWPNEFITTTFKKASGSMIYAGWHGISGLPLGKKSWITAIVSDMDNPNNSFCNSKNKTVFQGGRR